MEELTKVQNEIAEAPLGAAIVTAGAGSGKTRTLTHRLHYLVKNNIVEPCRIAALTFTNKAAKEMRERAEKMGHSITQAFTGTFHSFCVRLLRKNYNSNFSIYDTNDTKKVLKDVIKEIMGDDGDIKSNTELLKKAQFHLDEWKNEGQALDEYIGIIKYDKNYKLIGEILSKYQRRLAENNALDFDDLLLKTLAILRENEDVRQKLQERFLYILVDEFQDTNKVQYEIVAILAEKHKNIMVVGDEDQCIYTWRGASIENIERFKRDFPDAKIYKLEENFRSSKNIVSAANTLVAKNSKRIQKTLFSNIPDGEICIDCYFNENEEADRVVGKIIENKRRGVRYGDNAVLMRMNALSRVFEERLRLHGIPYVVWGGFKFYERAEIKSALNYLRLLVNSNDSVALYDVINWPKRGIGDGSVEKIKAGEKLSDKVQKAVNGFYKIVDELKEAWELGLDNLADNFLIITGLKKYYEDEKTEDENRLQNLYQLCASIKEFYASNKDAGLAYYLQTVTIDAGEEQDAGEQVVLSTVHSAKGLEFNNVFIIGLEEGLFPVGRAFDDDDDMEEERRLLYVAVTRAKRRLYMSFAKSRWANGERSYGFKSRFLTDMGYYEDDDDDLFGYSNGVNRHKKSNYWNHY
jgi:DNA helicase-2/ATP-dependent DNA helicase PcrA